eukprot:1029552-Pyramimonas_sp.AAC.1
MHCASRVSHPTGGNEAARQNVEPPAPAALRRMSLEEHPDIQWRPLPNVATGRASQSVAYQ